MIQLFSSLKYISKGGWLIPFKVRGRARIYLGRNVNLQLDSRLVIGPDNKLPLMSANAVNIYFDDDSEIRTGKSVVIGPGVNLVVKKKGKLEIGTNTYFTSDSHIEVVHSLQIGKDCAISWGVTIIDDDHHELLSDKQESNRGVTIGNHVWIGCNVTVLKNSAIGNNCMVAAGSVVKGEFPDNSLIAGNPARVIRNDINWK
jgi:acetyltransferase-like isoleucine patch superfamily enzyme